MRHIFGVCDVARVGCLLVLSCAVAKGTVSEKWGNLTEGPRNEMKAQKLIDLLLGYASLKPACDDGEAGG